MRLSKLRKLRGGRSIKILYFFIAMSFLFGFGVLPSVRRGCQLSSKDIIVGKEKITQSEIDIVSRSLPQDKDNLFRDSVQIAINRKVLALAAQEIGFFVTDSHLSKAIQLSLNLTSPQEYFSLLRSQRYNKEAFENHFKDLMFVERLRNIVARMELFSSEKFSKLLERAETELLKYCIVKIPFSKFDKNVNTKIKISSKSIEEEYTKNKTRWKTNEVRELLLATFTDTLSANSFLTEITSKAEAEDVFYDIASKHGGATSSFFISKGDIGKHDLMLITNVFSLGEKEFSKVFISLGKPSVAYVKKIYPERQKTFEEAKDEIELFLRRNILKEMAIREAEKIKTSVRNIKGLKKISKARGYVVEEKETPFSFPVLPAVGFSPDINRAFLLEKENFFVEPIAKENEVFLIYISERERSPTSQDFLEKIVEMGTSYVLQGIYDEIIKKIKIKVPRDFYERGVAQR